ncbi:hypothetical protein C8J56DRAFT_942711 [Mycena floridula]|nr:hypothetical protein C8J56DRAFT_942711 [Mycena floridula]
MKREQHSPSAVGWPKYVLPEDESYGWKHPDELPYPEEPDWPDDKIIPYLLSHAITIPPKPAAGRMKFDILSVDGTETTLPIKYRLPLLWIEIYRWRCLFLALHSPAEKKWEDYKLRLLYLSMISNTFLERARQEGATRRKGIGRSWRCPMFDRVLQRVRDGHLEQDPASIQRYWDEFGGVRYRNIFDGSDLRKLFGEGSKAIGQHWVVQDQQVDEGLTIAQMTQGLQQQKDGKWVWLSPAYWAPRIRIAPPHSADNAKTQKEIKREICDSSAQLKLDDSLDKLSDLSSAGSSPRQSPAPANAEDGQPVARNTSTFLPPRSPKPVDTGHKPISQVLVPIPSTAIPPLPAILPNLSLPVALINGESSGFETSTPEEDQIAAVLIGPASPMELDCPSTDNVNPSPVNDEPDMAVASTSTVGTLSQAMASATNLSNETPLIIPPALPEPPEPQTDGVFQPVSIQPRMYNLPERISSISSVSMIRSTPRFSSSRFNINSSLTSASPDELHQEETRQLQQQLLEARDQLREEEVALVHERNITLEERRITINERSVTRALQQQIEAQERELIQREEKLKEQERSLVDRLRRATEREQRVKEQERLGLQRVERARDDVKAQEQALLEREERVRKREERVGEREDSARKQDSRNSHWEDLNRKEKERLEKRAQELEEDARQQRMVLNDIRANYEQAQSENQSLKRRLSGTNSYNGALSSRMRMDDAIQSHSPHDKGSVPMSPPESIPHSEMPDPHSLHYPSNPAVEPLSQSDLVVTIIKKSDSREPSIASIDSIEYRRSPSPATAGPSRPDSQTNSWTRRKFQKFSNGQ